jgi:hypothetical protein
MDFKKLDIAPGWKTNVTAVVVGVFNLLRLLGWVDLDPSTVNAINSLLGSLIAMFLGLKVQRALDQ